jgi:hypothetical protein
VVLVPPLLIRRHLGARYGRRGGQLHLVARLDVAIAYRLSIVVFRVRGSPPFLNVHVVDVVKRHGIVHQLEQVVGVGRFVNPVAGRLVGREGKGKGRKIALCAIGPAACRVTAP